MKSRFNNQGHAVKSNLIECVRGSQKKFPGLSWSPFPSSISRDANWIPGFCPFSTPIFFLILSLGHLKPEQGSKMFFDDETVQLCSVKCIAQLLPVRLRLNHACGTIAPKLPRGKECRTLIEIIVLYIAFAFVLSRFPLELAVLPGNETRIWASPLSLWAHCEEKSEWGLFREKCPPLCFSFSLSLFH